MLAGQERVLHHLSVERRGCADVDNVDVRIVEHAAVVGLDLLDAVLASQPVGLAVVGGHQGSHLDET